MTRITDNGEYGWELDNLIFTVTREPKPSTLRYGPNDNIKGDYIQRVTREHNGNIVNIGAVASEVTGKWFYILPGRENVLGGISTETYTSRKAAVDALHVRITDRGTISNKY